MPPPKIITVIGSLNTDLITRTSRIPAPGETLTSQSFDTGSGGKGANQAVACARLSRYKHDEAATSLEAVSVRMIGAVGADEFGQALITGLERDGIDTSGIEVRSDAKTGVACIIVEDDTGENRILISPNANYTLKPDDFSSLPDPKPSLIVLQLEIPLEVVLQILKSASQAEVPVLLNPAPAVRLPDEGAALRGLDHLIVNESEAALLSGNPEAYVADHANLGTIANGFHDAGVENVVVTLGGRGAFHSSASGRGHPARVGFVKPKLVDVVDTTAAGDTFVGAYAVRVVRAGGRGTFDITKAVEWANAAAAKTVQSKGAQSAIPWLDEVTRDDYHSD
ncbi:MAG: hypothetical protein M1825_005832 [Sarcosagium campestre]|nr:MAG: hypothetical protein M1825_005832 [Sarcosagium campestre]